VKKNILLFFGIIFTCYINANNKEINLDTTSRIEDSLQKVYYFYGLANNFKSNNLDLALFYNKKALTLANKIKSPEACAITNELMGELFQKGHNLQPSINYYLISARIYENNKNEDKLTDIYTKLGELYYGDNFNLEKAHTYYDKALGIAIKVGNKNKIATIYNRIGGVFFYQSNFDESLDYYLKAYDLWKTLDNQLGIARSLNNIGEIYRINNNLELALNYYLQSLEINEKIESAWQTAVNFENIGMIKSAEGNTAQAFEYYQKSLKLYSENSFLDDELQLQILMGREYLKIGLLDNAFKFFSEAYKTSSRNNDLAKLAESSLGLSNVYEKTSDFKNALKYYKIHSQTNDSIVAKQKIDQLAIMQTNFLNDLNTKELELKENQISLYEKQQRIDTINYRFMVFVVLVIIVAAVLIVVRQRMQAKEEKIIRHKNLEIQRSQQELMKAEIKSKNNDLVNFALHLIQKNNLLKQLKTDLKNLSKHTDNETSQKLRELNMHLKQSLQMEKELEEFQQKVDRNYSDFFVKLKNTYPSLTKNEERLCAMLRLNLSSKEIAALNNTSLKAVEMSRYRLRKKCNIENNEELPNFLNKI
jgi:tetratricopeptide (TPR) repeat protein